MIGLNNYQQLWQRLANTYDAGEAKALARMVFEVRYGLTLADIVAGRDVGVPAAELEQIVMRLEQQEPIQYILGEATFCGHTFHVEPGVLIPRPETEQLCRMIVSNTHRSPLSILDIGTGSGCIAVSLALALSGSRVTAWDVSPEALRIARGNARRLGADVNFVKNDMLRQTCAVQPQWDIIVSNPPYICNSEAEGMDSNVLEHEPELALFVPDEDPLLFYRPIMNYAQSALWPEGTLWLEVNPLYEEHIEDNLLELGFADVEALNDDFGKIRFIKAIR